MQSLLHRLKSIQWRPILKEHGPVLLALSILTIMVTWPTVRYFTSHLVSDGGDAEHNLWVLWHYKEAFLGREPFFETGLLYYPIGASMLTHGLGPVLAVFSLPFWPFGAEAAHNGAVLVSVWLTGYAMYLLARALGFQPRIAFFAGLFLLMAPMHLAGLYGHMTKVFLGLLPLTILALHHALDARRSRAWTVATGFFLLLCMLHSGYQFVFAGLAVAFFALRGLIVSAAAERRQVFLRVVLIAVSSAVLVAPLLIATLRASEDPAIDVDLRLEAVLFQADVAELFLPFKNNATFGDQAFRFLLDKDVQPTVETAIYLTWTGILLSIASIWAHRSEARGWLLLTVVLIVLSAGPFLKFLGQTEFTVYDLDIILPFALASELPGLSFMRIPGRYMMLGYVTLGITAAYGLQWLSERRRWLIWPLVVAACALLLVETWPKAWPLEELKPVPDFYRQIAEEDELYGVMDLPFEFAPLLLEWTASYYQRFQLVHKKGMNNGYLSRTYDIHPMFPCIIPSITTPVPDVLVDDVPSDCSENLFFDLAYFNYRYVVRHKPNPDDWYFLPGGYGDEQAQLLVDRYFAEQEPLEEDDLVTVYQVPAIEDLDHIEATMSLGAGWGDLVDGKRYAQSPAKVRLSIPRPMRAMLHITPAFMYDPAAEDQMGDSSRLHVQLPGGFSTTVDLHAEENTAVLLDLPKGVYHLTLSLEAGNFIPPDGDGQPVSFATRWINLQTLEPQDNANGDSGS